MMTEDEAKTKWCPMYRVATSGGDPSSTYETDNRPENGEPSPGASSGWRVIPGSVAPHAACIGSACMAWRLGPERTIPASITEIAGAMREHGLGPLDATAATSRKVQDGYCGLAGAPQ